MMYYLHVLLLVFKRLLLIIALLLCFQAYTKETKPNIIFVLTDDQPYGYLGVTGNKVVSTPNIDELANDGVLFTNAHVTSAICTPSRVSILLSQYERMHGVNFNSGTSIANDAWKNSYPVLMKAAGYYTGWVGKNHVPVGKGGYTSGVMEESFDYWYANHGHMTFYPKERHQIFSEAKSNTQIEVVAEGINDFLDTNEHRFEQALTFLKSRPKNQPFLLSINLNLPHGSSTRTMEQRETDDEIYRTLYRNIDIPLPAHYVAKEDIKTPKLPPKLLRAGDRQSSYDVVNTEKDVKETYIRQMQAMTGIDRLIGKLRKRLEADEIEGDTIIIMTSDHGLFMGEHGLGGKALCYEKSTKVPIIIFNPRNRQNAKRTDALVSTIDIAPTILSLANISQPKSFQGEDLSGFLDKQTASLREYTYSENLWSTHFGNPRCESIQTNKWKYIRYYQNNNLSATRKVAVAKQLDIPVNEVLYGMHDNDIFVYRDFVEGPLNGEAAVYEELFHIGDDPLEVKNLVDDLKYQHILEELRSAWWSALTFARGEGSPKVYRNTVDMPGIKPH